MHSCCFEKMDIDENLFLNFVPIISVALLTIVTSFTIFYKLKNRWPVKVNCWFCNGYTKVWRGSLQWWLCPTCNQYNGFSEDGDYNYEIPEQHKIAKSVSKNKSYCERKNFSNSKNSLCKQCNRNEELKLIKLRELEDSIDENNDKEITRFERSFEKKYPLCLKCRSNVQTILHSQALWLTQYKMLLYKQKPIRRIIENQEKVERIIRIILSILASVSIYFSEAWYLPLCGIFFQILACLASPSGKRQSDIFPIFGWACLIWVKTFSATDILKVFKVYSVNDGNSSTDNTYQYFMISLGTAVGLANLRFKSYKTLSNGSLTFKKLETPNKNISMSCSFTPEAAAFPNDEFSFNKDQIRNSYSPVNITSKLMTPAAVETPIPLKSTSLPQHFEDNFNHSSNYQKTMFSTNLNSSFSKNVGNQSYSLDDSLTSLNSLSLGTYQKCSPSHSPKVFETKVYGTTSPNLFTKQNRNPLKRNILAPPKLRSVTQASWVAGGYWQSGIDMPTLSRSSSQSSGIGSSGSNYGPSREPSVHDFDQYSVVSEHCCFARPESPLSTRNSTVIKRRNTCSSRCMQTSDLNCSTESLQYDSRNGSQCGGHTTIITNPLWLPALLCGSLVFNMLVLCTILLR